MVSPNRIKLMVIAANFPSYIQEWMVTYLQQLDKHGLDYMIFSGKEYFENIPEKIIKMRITRRLVAFPFKSIFLLKYIVSGYTKNKFALLVRLPDIVRKISVNAVSGTGFSKNIIKILAMTILSELEKFDVIHAHSEMRAYEFLPYAKMTDTPMVITFHGLPPIGVSQLATTKRKVLYRFADILIVNTGFAKEQLIGMGCPPAKVSILPQGISLNEYEFCKKPCPDDSGPLRILSVGRLNIEKGHEYTIEAISKFSNDIIYTNVVNN